MKRKRSRLALLAVLALAISVTAGMSGGAAEAKKKGKGKKGGNTVTVTAGPVVLPPASAGIGSLTDIPLRVGKKAKGKVVSFDTVELTAAFSGLAGFLTFLELELEGPGGRVIDLDVPFDDESTQLGPLTWTPNSRFHLCPSTAPVPLACGNPKFNILRPYIGRANAPALAWFGGTPARGTWHLLAVNEANFAITLTTLAILIHLAQLQAFEPA